MSSSSNLAGYALTNHRKHRDTTLIQFMPGPVHLSLNNPISLYEIFFTLLHLGSDDPHIAFTNRFGLIFEKRVIFLSCRSIFHQYALLLSTLTGCYSEEGTYFTHKGRHHMWLARDSKNMAARRSARLSALSQTTNIGSLSIPETRSTIASTRKRKRTNTEAQDTSDSTIPRQETAPTTQNDPREILTEETNDTKSITTKLRERVIERQADPTKTNATLISPSTSCTVASKALTDISPSKKAAPSVITMGNLLEKACAHLVSVDIRMKPLIDAHHCRIFSPDGLAEKIDPFESLCSGIISQQVSGAAAKSIKARFIALFKSSSLKQEKARFPTPFEVTSCTHERLRTAGLSQRKAEYVKGLAQKFVDGELSAHMLRDAPYETVLEKLIAVRGLGQWSVEMFACFGLKRMDVFSLGDLGVQRGMAAFVGRDVNRLRSKKGKWKYMSEQEMREISDKFSPYRSLFMWYMWQVETTDVSTLE